MDRDKVIKEIQDRIQVLDQILEDWEYSGGGWGGDSTHSGYAERKALQWVLTLMGVR